jgi:hypothetical protein
LGKTLKEIVESSKVWLHFIDKPEFDLLGKTRGGISDTWADIGITRAAMDKGKMYVVATIVHELAHVDGAPGTLAKRRSIAAESTLKHCLLSPQFDPNAFGALDKMFRGDSGEALAHLIHRPAGRILITNRQLTCQHPAAAGWAAFQTVSVRR